ncbi:MAG: hypothetical protein WD883_00975 [Candidatus Colwellbacteria bacterium]
MEDKNFSTLETVFALLLVAPLDFIEAGFGFTGLTTALTVADLGVTFTFAMWLMMKGNFGGTTLTKAVTKWVMANGAELIPFLEVLPIRTIVMIVIIRQINKGDGEEEKVGGGGAKKGAKAQDRKTRVPLAA